MPILILKFKDNTISNHKLQKGKALTIGRRDNNDIVIENLAVSGHHAKIDSVGDGYVLTDLQSKNGCFVNEQLITSHWLKQGDIINIGKHSIHFTYTKNETIPKEISGNMDQTMVMDTSKYRKMMSKSASSMPIPKQSAAPRGVLAYLSGGEGEVLLDKKLIKIGKDTSSDIESHGLGVGQTAATVSKRPNGYYISFVGGMAKLKVNSEAVKDSRLLKDFDVIEVGSVKLQFFTKE